MSIRTGVCPRSLVAFRTHKSLITTIPACMAVLLAALLALPVAHAQATSGPVTVAPIIGTYAGNNASPGYSGDGGPAINAGMEITPFGGVATDGVGNVYIADDQNDVIRMVPAVSGTYFGQAMKAGDIYRIAGSQSVPGYKGDGGLATSAELNYPQNMTVDKAGNLYIADTNNHVIRMVPVTNGTFFGQSMTANDIYTIAGTGTAGYSGDRGLATNAKMNVINGVAVDGLGNVYVADGSPNNSVRMVAAVSGTYFGQSMTANSIYTIAGNGTACTYSTSNTCGDGGPATSAEMNNPADVTVDNSGNVYVTDYNNNRVRMVAAATGSYWGQSMTANDIYTIAGTNGGGYNSDNQPATSAELNGPKGVAMDRAGNLYIADRNNNRIRVVAAVSGTYLGQTVTANYIYTIAGNGTPGYYGDGGLPTIAELQQPFGVALDGEGNLYIADTYNHVIRKVAPDTEFPETAVGATAASQNIQVQFTKDTQVSGFSVPKAQNGKQEFTVGTVSGCTVPGTLSAGDTCTVPVTFSPLAPGLRFGALEAMNGSLSTDIVGSVGLTGMATGPMGIYQPGMASVLPSGSYMLNGPTGVTVDPSGDVYIADGSNNRVLEVSASGTVSIVKWVGSLKLNDPIGLAMDAANNLYIADRGNNRIVEVSPAGVASVVGTGSLTLNFPNGVGVDSAGDLFIADRDNNRIVEVSPAGVANVVVSDTVQFGSTTLNNPSGVAVDSAGDIFISDLSNNRVVEFSAAGVPSVVSSSTPLSQPHDLVLDAAGDLYVANWGNGTVVELPANGGTAYALQPGKPNGTAVGANVPGVATDGLDNVYFDDYGNNRVVEINQTQQTLNFVAADMGVASGSNPQSATLQNVGNALLTLSSDVTFTGTDATSFSSDSTTTCSNNMGLNPGDTCLVAVDFTPLAAGALTGYANIADDSLNATTTQQITLNGAGQYATTTVLTVSPGPSVAYGISVTLTATVTNTSASPNSPVTSGTVTFYNGTTVLGTGTPNANGVATLTTTALPTGSDSLTASYATATGSYYAASTSAPVTETVTAATTTTWLSLSPTSAAYGAQVKLTATVSSSVGTPTGTVTFYNGSTSLGTGTLNTYGVATLTTTTLPVGSDSLTATFAAQGNYAASNSNTVTETITQANTTTNLTANPTSTVYGAPVTLTATVTNSSVSPNAAITTGGVVTFYDGTTVLGTQDLNNAGQAAFTTTALPLGTDSVTATFTAQTNYASSTSKIVPVTISLSAAAGDVLAIDTGYTGTYVPAMGAFQPDEDFTGSDGAYTTNATINVANAINAAPPMIYQSERFGPMIYTIPNLLPGNTYTVRLHFAEIYWTKVGQRIFNVAINGTPVLQNFDIIAAAGGQNIAITEPFEATADSGGNITINFTDGSVNFPKISGIEILASMPSTTTLAATPTSGTYGTSVTLTATVSGQGYTPTGTVVFSNNGIPIGIGTIATANGASTATLTTTALLAGTDNITATYQGVGNFGPSTSQPVVVTLGMATPVITWTPPAAIPYGTALSGTQLDAATTPTVAGTFTYNPASGAVLSAGTHTLTATFTPTDTTDYTTATATVQLTVDKATLTAAIVGNPTKPYDGTTTATLVPANFELSGLVGTDLITVTQPVGQYAAATAGPENVTATLAPANFTATSGSLANYTLPTTASGPGTITQAPTTTTNATISWPKPAAITYGTPLSATQLDAQSSLLGTFTYTPKLGTVLAAGTQTLAATFTPTDSTDYAPGTATVLLTVNQAPLTVTANNATRPYNTPNPAFTATVTGAVNGDTFTESLTTTATQTSPAGTYPIVPLASGTDIANYNVSYVNGTLTVAQASPLSTIAWSTPTDITYGTPLSATQLDAQSSIHGTFTYDPPANTVLSAGKHTLTAIFTPTDTTDYTTGTATVTLIVNQAPLTVTANNASRPYNTPNPTFSASVTGAVNGDTFTESFTTTATQTSPAGTYSIVPLADGTDISDYKVTYVNGTLTVTPASATTTITWQTPAAISYGTPLGNAQLNASSTLPGTFTYSPSIGTVLGAGTHTLTATFTPTDLTDYQITSTTVPLVVNPATLTVTANNATRPYNTPNPVFTGSVTGAVNGDTFTESFTTTATTASPVGSYPIVPSAAGPNLANYTVVPVNGTLTVAQASAASAITWPTPAPIVYGTKLGPAQLDATSSVPGIITYSPASGTVLNAGAQKLTATFVPTDTTDYTTGSATVTLQVNPAPLTAAVVGGPSKAYDGTTAATLTPANFALSPMVGSDSITVTQTVGTYASAAVGPEMVTVALAPFNFVANGSTSLTNYVLPSSAAGLGTITQGGLTIIADNATRVYGTNNPTFTGEVTGDTGGANFTEVFSTTATQTSPVGNYQIVPSLLGTNLANYTVTVVDGTLTITKAGTTTNLSSSAAATNQDQNVTLTATVASDTTGAPTGTVTFYSGTSSIGTATLNAQGVATLTLGSLPPGNDSLTAQYGGDTNFTGSTSTGVNTIVTAANFTLALSTPTLSLVQGATATDNVTLTPTGGYSGPVTLSCSGLPTFTTCTFAPNPVAFNGSGQPVVVQLTLNTNVQSAQLRARPQDGPGPLAPVVPALAFWWPGSLAGLVAIGRKRKLTQKQQRWSTLLLLLLATGALAAGVMGCAGGGIGPSTTYTGQYNVTITGTGSLGNTVLTQTVGLNLTITQAK